MVAISCKPRTLQPCRHVCSPDGFKRAVTQRLPMHVEIPIGEPVGARPQSGFFGVKIALDDHTQGQVRRGRLGTCSGALSGRINARLGLGKTLARRLAGSFSPYLASVAENFATLLRTNAILHDPAFGVAAQANPEARQIVVPLQRNRSYRPTGPVRPRGYRSTSLYPSQCSRADRAEVVNPRAFPSSCILVRPNDS